MAQYRSSKRYKTEEFESMGSTLIRVIGIDDDMVVGILTPVDFENQFEVIQESEPEIVPD